MSKAIEPPPEIYHKLGPSGEILCVNMLTGEQYPLINVNKDTPSLTPSGYTLEYGEAICALVREGFALKQIASKLSLPPSVVYRWRTLHPDFNEKYKAAKQDRAEHFHAAMVEIADNLKDNVEHDKTTNEKARFEMYSKLAAIDAPSTFGSKTVVSGDAEAPIIIKLETGIRRSKEESAHTVQAEQAALAREQENIIEATAVPVVIPQTSDDFVPPENT